MTPNQRKRALSALLPDDPEGLPVERLARRLLAEAEASPALIGRAATAPAIATPRESQPFAAMALLSDPALDVRQYLEDLVTIAVNSAQQAEDLAVQAREASRKARRGMAGRSPAWRAGPCSSASRASPPAAAPMSGWRRSATRSAPCRRCSASRRTSSPTLRRGRPISATRSRAHAWRQPQGIAPAVATVIAQPPPTAAPPARQPAPATYYFRTLARFASAAAARRRGA